MRQWIAILIGPQIRSVSGKSICQIGEFATRIHGRRSLAKTEIELLQLKQARPVFRVTQNLGGSFDNDADRNVFKATFGGSFGSHSFGNVAEAGLSEEFVSDDLTVVGSLAGGGDFGNVDLVYVPEPASSLLLATGLVIGLLRIRRTGI